MEIHRPALVGSWPKATWDFEDLTLAAFYFHPDLDVARARYAVAQAGRKTAGQRPNPTAAVTPGYNTTSSGISPWILNFSLDVPLETAGKRGHRRAQAAHLSEAARWSLAATAWHVRSRLRRALLALYISGESRTLLAHQETLQSNLVHLLEAQLEAGAVSGFDVTQARIALDQTRLTRLEAEKQQATARLQVADAIGLPPAALDPVQLLFEAFQQIPGDLPDAAARRQALFNRADVLGALAEYAATEAALRLEIAKQYPDVHFNPGYEFDQGDDKWMLGLSLDLPVLNQNQGPIAEAEARRKEKAAQFQALQAQVLHEIEQARTSCQLAGKKMAVAESLNASLEQEAKTARAMLQLGEISRLEFTRRELERNTSALARLEALATVQEVFGDLEDALQSPVSLGESLWLQSPRSAAHVSQSTSP
jgi:outer membrane protein TolC